MIHSYSDGGGGFMLLIYKYFFDNIFCIMNLVWSNESMVKYVFVAVLA